MNTNQIPPGIIAFKMDNGITGFFRTSMHDYEYWATNMLAIGYKIHTIEQDGTEWSVGDFVVFTEYQSYHIKSFTWYDKQGWVAVVDEYGGTVRVKNLTKPLPHSGGEEKAYNDSVIEQQREEYRKLYRENESLKQQLKEKQGWSDESLKDAFEAGSSHGAQVEREQWYAKITELDFPEWLTEYKSQTGNNQINQM